MKNIKWEGLTFAGLLAVSVNVAAFNNGDIISFDRGVKECIIPDICDLYPELEFVTKGSYFALDTNANGRFDLEERVAISPGPYGGIVLGLLQPGPSIDLPWLFANIEGIHQTTTIPVTQNQNGSLDFSGWEVAWNGMVVSLGDGMNATVSCGGALPCAVSDPYQIDYTSVITTGPFAGAGYHLHLENIDNIPSLDVSLSISGGNVQECASTGGHNVSASASVSLFNGAQLDTIQWTIDGQDAGSGTSVSPFLTLGTHNISVTATAITGLQDTETATITIVDKTGPVISASFIDKRSGNEITSIETKNTAYIGVSFGATDICDDSPSVSGVGGFMLNDGDTLKIQGNLDKVELTTSTLNMSVTAADASNNRRGIIKTLNITP